MHVYIWLMEQIIREDVSRDLGETFFIKELIFSLQGVNVDVDEMRLNWLKKLSPKIIQIFVFKI